MPLIKINRVFTHLQTATTIEIYHNSKIELVEDNMDPNVASFPIIFTSISPIILLCCLLRIMLPDAYPNRFGLGF